YCTNIHRGESWAQTWKTLEDYTLKVRDRVAPGQPYGIGLRLGDQASRELAEPCQMAEFQEWLEKHNCYVFTINGFPYGNFHGTRVKEQVFKPDWASKERLEYTNRLFDILSQLLPKGTSGSVSTLPGSHKEFGIGIEELEAIFANLKACSEHIQAICDRTGQDLHLGLEPEPLGLIETSGELIKFFGLYVDTYPGDRTFLKRVGVNYDCCHLAVEFEEAQEALQRIYDSGIRLSKLHLSSALKLKPTPENLARLREFDEPVYFHQVIIREGDTPLRRLRDIPNALEMAAAMPFEIGDEWRVHFHVPLHASPTGGFSDTKDHILGALDWLAKNPTACQHLEMETYTWEVLPEELRSGDVVDQLTAEYEWTLAELAKRGLR
ncbi:MAG: metabolite traffic protein EboE, partial [Verrucomicrobium sp.]